MSKWQIVNVTEFADVVSGATPATNVKEYWDGGIEWVTPTDLSKLHSRFIKNSERNISNEGLRNSSVHLTPKNNIVMSSRAPIGYLAIPINDFTTNQGCKTFILKDGHNSEYHYYNFLFNIEQIKRFGVGSTFAEISKTDIEKLNFKISTDPSEQRKIALILSTVDAVIEKTEATITKYKAIKQGMMQDLFTRGLDKNGKLRPRYQEAPELYKKTELGWIPKEWDVIPLVNVTSEKPHSFTGGPFGSDLQTKHYTDSGVRIIQLQNIGDGYFFNDYEIFTSVEKADSLFYCNIFPGDIIIAKMADPVARACIIPDFAERYLMASDGIRLKVNENKYDTNYILEIINHHHFRQLAVQKSTGSTRERIGLTELRQLPIKVPKEKSEQTGIANIFLALNEQFDLERSSAVKLNSLKTALMSVLLTGKVQVQHEQEKN
jgi:type I restriction enzyme, S subunit